MAFPVKLSEMLTQVDDDGLSHIISWQPHGRCFVVHDPAAFKQLLPNFFKLSKIASFQRQLNLYGFQRLTVGLDKGGYYHELFLRGRPDLVARIQRVKVKGTGVRAKANPKEEPNLYLYPAVDTIAATAASMNDSEIPPTVSPERQPSSLPQVLPVASSVTPENSFPEDDDDGTMEPPDVVRSIEWQYQQQEHHNPSGILRNLSSFGESLMPSAQQPSKKRLLRNLSSSLEDMQQQDPTRKTTMLDDNIFSASFTDATMQEVDVDVSFDVLINEMFRHDQSLDFSDLLKLAAV